MDGVQLCDRKRHREENPQDDEQKQEPPPPHPPPGDNNNNNNNKRKRKRKKRKRKLKNKGEGSEVYPNHHQPVSSISITASLNTDTTESVEPIITKPLLNEADDAHESDPIQQQLSTSQLRIIKKPRKRNQRLQKKTDATVKSPVQTTQGLTVKKVAFKRPTETSERKYNAKSHVQTRCPPITDGVKVTEPPVKRHAECSMICRACRQHGHKSKGCPRLKCLSKDEEICFFCGEIGHSLGKCSVSTAGGGRFAKCLFCYAQGHLSINCPQNGYRIDPKVAAAKWAYQQNSAK